MHPAGWIDAGHRNSVPVLGTIIIEGNNQQLLQQLLTGPEDHYLRSPRFDPFFVDRLAALCEECNFDGYLINMELPNIPGHLVQMLQQFVKELRDRLKKISPFHQIIWYDSIDSHGYLNYQNKLNGENRPYFNNADGIFLNYWWKPNDLLMTKQAAGKRRLDVYVGIDIWGRGSHSGGGYNTAADLALIKQYGLSCALFAPGWIFEHEFDCHYSSDYLEKEAYFWHNTVSEVTLSGQMELSCSPSCVAYYRGEHGVGYSLPLYSNFSTMTNSFEYVQGKQITASHYNPRFCSTLPWTDHTESQGSELQGVLNGSDGFNSNGCFTVHSYVGGKTREQELILFSMDDALFAEPLILSVVCKKEDTVKWSIALHGSVHTVEPLLPKTSPWNRICPLYEDAEGETLIRCALHTSCGNGWERWWWVIYPIMKNYTVTAINRVCLRCESDVYQESTCSMGAFYLNKVKTHELILNANYMPSAVRVQPLETPMVKNKKEALQYQYSVLHWQCDRKDVVLEDGIMPIVDFFRVYVNGSYYGKTKTMNISLRKRIGLAKRQYSVIIQPVTIYGSAPSLSKCKVVKITL